MRYVSAEEMRRVDIAAEENGLPVEVMMETAGKGIAEFVHRLKGKRILVIYGKGNNGGGVLVAAKYLLERGYDVRIRGVDEHNENVEQKLKDLRQFKVKRGVFSWLEKGDVILDGMLGYNIKGTPSGKFVEWIEKCNNYKKKGVRIVSNDLPSGMNPDTGAGRLMVNADYILTEALPKLGLKGKRNVYLIDLGISKNIYNKAKIIGVEDYFQGESIIKVS